MDEQPLSLDKQNKLLRENLELERRLGRYDAMLAVSRYRLGIFLALLVVAVVFVAFYPRVFFYANFVFNPTKVPGDYKAVDEYVINNAGDARVMWVPFINPEHMYYDWAPEKRISPFNVWSSNPSLNNMQEAYDPENYFYWLSQLFQKEQPFSVFSVRLMSKDLTLPDNIASRLFIPFSARYMIFDSSINGYTFEGSFDRDTSLKRVFRTPLLNVYAPDYSSDLIRVAEKTLKVNSFYDNLAVSQSSQTSEISRISFVDRKPVTASFSSVGKKYGLLDINAYRRFIPINSGFETGKVRDPSAFLWAPASGATYLLLTKDSAYKVSGKYSLKAVNLSTREYDFGWVRGVETPVKAGEFITFDSSVKYRNASWTGASLEGFRDDTREWVQLGLCPSPLSGTGGWKRYSFSLVIPRGISAIRPALAAGWILDKTRGPAISWFDDVRIARVDPQLYSDLFSPGQTPKVSFRKINGEKYQVHVRNAKKPFLLVFGEAFDSFWVARTADGEVIQPAPLYSTINGFQVDKKGDFDLTIEYQPQKWYLNGRVVAVVAVIICAVLMLYDWKLRGKRRNAAILKRTIGATARAGSRIRKAIEAPPRR
jgi:hypothetical protein